MKTAIFHILLLTLLVISSCESTETGPSPEQARQDPLPVKHEVQLKNIVSQPVSTPVISRFITDEKQAHDPEPENSYTLEEFEPYYILPEGSDISVNNPATRNEIRTRQLAEKYDIPALIRKGRISPDIVAGIIFDNDIIDYTDYYYTSGLGAELYHPAIVASPLSQLLPGLRGSLNYYGISLIQNLYTPIYLNITDIQTGDRPFASYLSLTHHRVSLSAENHRRLETSFSLGVIGPAALGGIAQDLIHDEQPVGWVNQVSNDVIFNYSVRFDQGFISGPNFDLAVYAGGQAGTLYDNLKAGIHLQAGKNQGRFGGLFLKADTQRSFWRRIQYYFTLDLENKLVFYDATLLGGMFNHNNIYTLQQDQIHRYIFTGKAGLGLAFGKYTVEAEQVFLTPEYPGGRRHLWFRIRNVFYFN